MKLSFIGSKEGLYIPPIDTSSLQFGSHSSKSEVCSLSFFFLFFFERVFSFFNRIMVGLPSMESRGLILRRLLSKEKVDEGLDFKELATMTEG
jgi:hypothetical protein